MKDSSYSFQSYSEMKWKKAWFVSKPGSWFYLSLSIEAGHCSEIATNFEHLIYKGVRDESG